MKVAIPNKAKLPPGLKFLLRRGRVRGVGALTRLNQCSRERQDCANCPFLAQCEALYREMIDKDEISNWRGASQNVRRYFR